MTFCVLFVLLCSAANASEYTSLGITRDQVTRMLTEEGLDPTFNQFPPVDGEPYNEVTVWGPYINIGMFGPDEGLTTISLSLQPSSDEGDSYWHSFVSLWILAAAFPNWENREEWLNRTLRGMANGRIKKKLEFQRDGRQVEAVMTNGFLFFEVSGVEP